MKHVITVFLFSLLILTLNSCKKDEGKLPIIEFRTGAGYTSSDTTVTAGSDVTVGIHAAKAEEADVLTKFNVSSSTDGGTPMTLEDTTLSGADGDQYDVDYTLTAPAGSAGHHFKFTFTVTNRDGLTNSVSLTLTAN